MGNGGDPVRPPADRPTGVGSVDVGRVPALRGTCAAPYTSLRFEPDGRVTVCCINGQYTLGRIGRDSVQEIWGGQRLQRLRDAIEVGDFSLGCLDCKQHHETGNRHHTQAIEFDRLVGADLGRWPQRLEFALSNTCNLQCVMCNGELSSSIRSHREGRPPLPVVYDDRFFDEMRAFLPHAQEIAFLGGEPLLSRQAMRIWDLLLDSGLRPDIHVTTNGTILTPRLEEYIRHLAMNVNVSIDAVTAETFESIRVGSDHAATMANCGRLRSITRECGRSFSINTCVMVSNWHEFPDLLLAAEADATHVTAIVVIYPRQMSLVHLPEAALRQVITGLEDRDVEMLLALHLNRLTWDRTLAQLREAAERIQDEIPVRLLGTNTTEASVQRRLSSLVASLEASTGRPAVMIEVRDDIVGSVTPQPWAAPLGLDSLVGESLLRLLPTLAHRLQFDPEISVEQLGTGLSRTTMEAVGDHWGARFTSLMGEWNEGTARRTRIALVTEDNLALIGQR